MRPVSKGEAPREYQKYQEARYDLENELGRFCSYCERTPDTHLAVEHVQPKKPGGIPHPERVLDWNNFLLACANCNSCKGETDIELDDYLWPHRDNTMLAFQYGPAFMVRPHPNLDEGLKAKARAMIQLVGLDKHPANPDKCPDEEEPDRRYIARTLAWTEANLAKVRLRAMKNSPCRQFMQQQVLATATTMFSIWMTVFHDYEEMRKGLLQKFQPIAPECFDCAGRANPRPGGQC